MTKVKAIATAGVTALTLLGAVGTSVTPAEAWYRGGWGGPFIGGLAAGAIVGGALAPRYYGPGPYYGYYGAGYRSCVRRVWGPYGWHWARFC